ncbi:uncharacterized protein KGF55_003428 [Candida pseudojiufengensis]|uniref:uncharacterized protein n=1 Tax=Candida pseudojiufengensis TaxID=497109 RepID=UPI0022254BA3|nr:uncharacterized protein KGF55_003428 [Candida pseudojiufengensis]KAI5962352.1 hypothetical protein KGF55_003428 [Candida pseudojiufengensis]
MNLITKVRLSFRQQPHTTSYQNLDYTQTIEENVKNDIEPFYKSKSHSPTPTKETSINPAITLKNNNGNYHHSRNSSITFPGGEIPEDFGLPPINKLNDVQYLQRFEVIRYLDAFNIFYDNKTNENELRNILRENLKLKKKSFLGF